MPELLPVPFRKTIVIDFEKILTDFTSSSELFPSAQSLKEDISKIHNTRLHLCKLNISIHDLNTLVEYYTMVQRMGTLFEETNVGVRFTWIESLSYKAKTYVSSSFDFESQNVLYNIGCMYSLLGVETFDKSSVQSVIQSCKYFQQAAKCFNDVLESTDSCIEKNTLQSIINLMLGQAQEMVWLKSVLDGKIGNKIVSRLAYQTSKYFETSSLFAKKSETMTTQWDKFIDGRSQYFTAVAYYRLSLDLNEAQIGLAIKCLTHCLKCTSKSLEELDNDEEIMTFNEFVIAKLKALERENDFSYMQRVPHDLPIINPYSLVKFVDCKLHSSSYAIFRDVVPFKLMERAESFNAREQEYISEYLIATAQKSIEEVLRHVPQQVVEDMNIELPILIEDYENTKTTLFHDIPQLNQELNSKLKKLQELNNEKQDKEKMDKLVKLETYLKQGESVDMKNQENFNFIDKALITNYVNINALVNPALIEVEREIEKRELKIIEMHKLKPSFFQIFKRTPAQNIKNIDNMYSTHLDITYKDILLMIDEWVQRNKKLIANLQEGESSPEGRISETGSAVLQNYKLHRKNFIQLQNQVQSGLQYYKDISVHIQSMFEEA